MTENPDTGTCLFKELMEYVFHPDNYSKYNYNYFNYLDGEMYYYEN